MALIGNSYFNSKAQCSSNLLPLLPDKVVGFQSFLTERLTASSCIQQLINICSVVHFVQGHAYIILALVLVCIALINICSVGQGVSQKPAKLYALEILIIAGGCGCARKLCCALQAPIKFCFSMMEGPSHSVLSHPLPQEF